MVNLTDTLLSAVHQVAIARIHVEGSSYKDDKIIEATIKSVKIGTEIKIELENVRSGAPRQDRSDYKHERNVILTTSEYAIGCTEHAEQAEYDTMNGKYVVLLNKGKNYDAFTKFEFL